MSAMDNFLGMLGNIGNAMGVQGDNPQGYNALQRIAANAPNVEAEGSANVQNNLAKLINTPGFLQMSPGFQAKELAKIAPTSENVQRAMLYSPGFQQEKQPNNGQATSNVGEQIGQGKIPDSQQIINNTLGFEGGYNPSDGASKSPVIFGINSKDHPKEYAQAKKLNDTQGVQAAKDYATNFYKTNYWDANNLDVLPPQSAAIVFDGLVNHRPEFGQQLLGAARAGALPSTLIGMRSQEYNRLASADPANYSASLPGWNQRLISLSKTLPTLGGQQQTIPQGWPKGLPMPVDEQEPPEITDLRQDITNAQRMRFMVPPEKQGEFNLQLADKQAKLAELSPNVIAAKTRATQQNTYQKTPEGTYVLPSQQGNIQNIQSSAIQTPLITGKMPIAMDGKPLLSSLQNGLYDADPKGLPKFSTPNTESGLKQNELNQKEMSDGSKEFATLGRNFALENSRLENLMDLYQKTQSGTFIAQHPEFVNKLISLGIVPKESAIDLGHIQAATNAHILDALSQIKDTNANVGGGAATRTFSSEIGRLLEEGASVKDQPNALFNILTQAKGIVNHGQDLIKGWNAIGGRGNRARGGDSILPDDYTQQFLQEHDLQDYVKAATKVTPALKGIGNENRISYIMRNGQLVRQ